MEHQLKFVAGRRLLPARNTNTGGLHGRLSIIEGPVRLVFLRENV